MLFWGVTRKCFLAKFFFTVCNKEIVTKLAKKIGRERPAVQLFCNVYTVLVWLYMTFILLFCLVQDSWLRLTKEYFYSKSGFTIRFLQTFTKILGKHLWWSLFQSATLSKSDPNTGVINVNFAEFSRTLIL